MDNWVGQLDRISVAELCALLNSGTTTARGLTEACFRQINNFDDRVNAVIERNPEALAIADERDAERRLGATRGPMHGLPVMIKDNIDTGDCMATTGGSLALVGAPAPKDAFIVDRLRKAGLVIIGKTNLSEWANFRATKSSSGWSSRGGQTRNPYALDRTPGGSSSGSGVAVACGFTPFAVGTETDGSILVPAAMNGIVGIKPTVGLVSRSGIIPISHRQDTAGPMARSVADAAALLTVLAAPDPEDTATTGSRLIPDYMTFLDKSGLKGARIGVASDYCGFHDGIDTIFADCLTTIRAQGAEVVAGVALPTREAIRPSERRAMTYEFKAGLNAYFARRGPTAPMQSLEDVIAFNTANADTTMPYFAQDILEEAQTTGSLEAHEYRAARAKTTRFAATEGIDAAITAHGLDAIAAPTACVPWHIDWINGDDRSGGSTTPAAAAGYPSITVPAGYLCGLPIGLSLFTSEHHEPKLIQMAYAFEQATRFRQPPNFNAHAGT